jgi:hypothetical protein
MRAVASSPGAPVSENGRLRQGSGATRGRPPPQRGSFPTPEVAWLEEHAAAWRKDRPLAERRRSLGREMFSGCRCVLFTFMAISDKWTSPRSRRVQRASTADVGAIVGPGTSSRSPDVHRVSKYCTELVERLRRPRDDYTSGLIRSSDGADPAA